tara:strand:+ start:272 stop:1228 length:957 start_codon:yes stop_codon:yes gene_type:complete
MIFRKEQLWPTIKKENSNTLDWLKNNIKNDLSIDKNTKIISLGSCFAREIKFWLLNNGFNYLLGEDKKNPWKSKEIFTGDNGTSPNEHASIAWERVYNTFTFKHIVDYTFNDTYMDERLLEVNIKGKNYVSDIIRTRMLYPNKEVAIKDIKNHIEESRKMFTSADVVIFTLGLTEIWESKKRNIVASTNPFKHYKLPNDFKFRVSRFNENLENLKYSYEILKKHNKNLKFLVTVSPVHLLATYRDDLDVISASSNSKSTLRSVADEFKDIDGVTYFPSYEIASIAAGLDGVNAFPDNHHVSKKVVNHIMQTFNKNFVK